MSSEAVVEGAINRAFASASEAFITAAGPGGQNVNKVATAVQMRVSIYALRLSPPVFERMKDLAGSRLTDAGEILLTARRFRTQEANRADARERLAELIREAHKLPEKRVKSRLNRVGKTARLEEEEARRGEGRARKSLLRLSLTGWRRRPARHRSNPPSARRRGKAAHRFLGGDFHIVGRGRLGRRGRMAASRKRQHRAQTQCRKSRASQGLGDGSRLGHLGSSDRVRARAP
jgi:ribosome-associated protein